MPDRWRWLGKVQGIIGLKGSRRGNSRGEHDTGKRRLPEDFDEREYLDAHPDIAAAVAAGQFASGASHWLIHGWQEGRELRSTGWPRRPARPHRKLPPDFDEADYLQLHPDVAAAVAMGQFRSGAEHWLVHGRNEGRAIRRSGYVARSLREDFDAKSYARLNPDLEKAFGDDRDALFEHWVAQGYRENRPASAVRPYLFRSNDFRKLRRKRDGINYFGFLDSPSGLGTAARGYRSALARQGYRTSSVCVRTAGKLFSTRPDVKEKENFLNSPEFANKVNIFHLNADMFQPFFMDGRTYLLDDSYNIGLWVWELASFRPDWAPAFGAVDEIWVPSEFCRAAVSAISPLPVYTIPHPVELQPATALLPRSHFDLPSQAFVFGCIFDVGSVIERKNPAAAIAAFRNAFGKRDDVILVLKYHGTHHHPGSIDSLRDIARGADNIRFVDSAFSEHEILSFKHALDCLVSPHRSEGFGLNIAEAMYLGKPVIATGYSGNLDFMDQRNSFLADYRLVEVREQVGPYPIGSLWADPDVEHLAALMRSVVENPEEARRRGETAALDIRRTLSLEAVGARVAGRLAESGVFERLPPFAENWKRGATYTWAYPEVPGRSVSATDAPMFSVVVPVFNIDPDILGHCVESVRRQSYGSWELILHDDCSTRPETREALHAYRGVDPRIIVSFGEKNTGIADATNAAIALSRGEFIALLDHDDEIAPDALAEMAGAIAADPNADLLYSDEDKIDPDGSYCDPYFKPDWSPEHLESVMYLLHMLVVRRSLLLEIGGLRAAYSGAQDYDVALRASRRARAVVHVPKVLYHWRKIPGSAAAKVDAKPSALKAAERALDDYLKSEGREASVEPGLLPGLFRVRDRIGDDADVSLVIFTDNRTREVTNRGTINMFDNFIASIRDRTAGRCRHTIIAVDNGNLESRQREMVAATGGRTLSYPGPRNPFNFAAKANFALRQVTSRLVVLLNDDMEVISPGWLDALVELAVRPEIGIVGAKLLYPDDRLQHCGIVLGINDHVAHIYHGWPREFVGHNGYTHLIRNYLAVTGACMATRMSVINEVGGFDERFAVDFNDIDLCLRVRERGYRNVYTPFAELYHFEGATQVRSQASAREHALFVGRWKKFMECDPYYNPNLTREKLDFSPQ
jgi:GT2 family glycosyltransferase/glycosyltransferase involved in cell wall biosynthesis